MTNKRKTWGEMLWISRKCAENDPSRESRASYRDRPEPKRKTVNVYGRGRHWAVAGKPCSYDTHRITFDLIDEEPDPASIKMERIE